MTSARTRGLPVFAFALGGLLLGHAIAYLVAVPDPHHRDLALARTGHAYLPAAAELALVLLLAGVAALVVRAWTPGGRERSPGWPAATLALVQVGAFVGQEVLERVAAGAPLASLVREPILAAGVAIQVLVALVAAAVLRWLALAAVRLAERPARPAAPRLALVPGIAPSAPRPDDRLVPLDRTARSPPSA